MKILFVKSPCGIGYGYMEGAKLDTNEAFGMEMVNLGYAELLETSAHSLPNDIPGRDILIAAGLLSVDDVKAIEDLTGVEGIDVKLASRITKYLSK